jgi:predicted ABC-type ATPase
VVVLAGPNGAGKTTVAPALVRDTFGIREYVNADAIARGLSGFGPETVGAAAGRLMLRRLRELAAARVSFAVETTLAGRALAPWLRSLYAAGYYAEILYFWVPVEAAVARVAARAAHGGHVVPPDVVARRYQAGLFNLQQLYRSAVLTWAIYDSTTPGPVRLVAYGNAQDINVVDAVVWGLARKACRAAAVAGLPRPPEQEDLVALACRELVAAHQPDLVALAERAAARQGRLLSQTERGKAELIAQFGDSAAAMLRQVQPPTEAGEIAAGVQRGWVNMLWDHHAFGEPVIVWENWEVGAESAEELLRRYGWWDDGPPARRERYLF